LKKLESKGVMRMYKVEKKDGKTEEFDKNKVLTGVTKAGGSAEEAQKVLEEVEAWLPEVAEDGVVKSSDVRTKVLAVLRTVNSEAAKTFESYKK
jgi:transcriptional regulator NrdR family protein